MNPWLNAHGEAIAPTAALLADDAALPETPCLVSLTRWQAEAAALCAAGVLAGVRLPNTADIAALHADVLTLPLLALDFPGFADGRAYSQATLLRRRGYAGRLLATGAAVVHDQLLMMRRCGMDAFALRDGENLPRCTALLQAPSAAPFYQPDRQKTTDVPALRLASHNPP